ncbi:MAG: glutamate ABC transporter substrate-binding protein [Dehalococcoidia bacterium]
MTKYAKFLFVLLALISTMALIAACGDDDDDDDDGGNTTPPPTFTADSTMGKIAAAKKMTVGVKFDQPGFGLKDPASGKVDGFDVAIAKEIAKAIGLSEDEIDFVEAVSANRIPFLQEDKVDIVVATMTINEDRKKQIDFSRPYYLAGQSILVMKDNTTIKSVEDLNGKKVCSVQGSTSEKNVQAKAPQAELLSLTGYAACVSSMKDGRVEAVSTDDIILAGFAAADDSLKLVGGQFTQEPYGIGIKQGKDDMVEFVDTLLANWFKDGTWDKIYNKYLGDVEGLPSAADARAKLPPTN